MNSTETQAQNSQIGHVMCAARKAASLRQEEIASRLGVSQGYLSKLENGQIIPDAVFWFNFCDLVKIPYESLRTGYIDFLTPAKLRSEPRENGFKLPREYMRNRGTTVRALIPALAFARQKLGETAFNQFLEANDIASEFFAHMDNQLHITFFFKLVDHLIDQKLLSSDDLSPLAQAAQFPESHGSLKQQYDHCKTPLAVIDKFVRYSRLYDCDFEYEVSNRTDTRLEVRVTPQPHLMEAKGLNPEKIEKYLCEYRRHFFSYLSSYRGMTGLNVSITQCTYKGTGPCVYEFDIKVAHC